MKLIRWVLGRIILGFNFVFSPKGQERSEAEQQAVNEKTKNLSLYQFDACPFCVKVRRQMKRQSLDIELRDAKNDATHRQDLENGGGRVKVPCLRIDNNGETTWMYESNDIVAYLQKEFA
ncbi:putative Glutaredoxin [Vibrio nigripulchritudo SFn27]|uniref:Putative Glutaredoxin n=1 Tax=Vibrio nigripulchritudo TaxID=28173 RepID=U4KCI8_9VIBR|nr:glutaredoxin domain-containing protein [Vibrio nigripulchritudo]KJY67902.1 glutaredoxin [Vibrio nigripulchritudo]CCN33883.1 putative Glutaredoxin [Vibrio nigripulchritudo AM115]CCN42993.1 putative Glutaredoxin [Vibrio nigripulchritudo FTn2]CCN65502.1 putative Glutaredoxin [Vibrio nigripulchritudo POn4]CCN75022.1 putative Glutaredoxin [Vibrio nigripulchritudo SO65]